MKQSAVNRHIFIRDIKRSWPVWAGMTLVYVMGYVPEFIWKYENYLRYVSENNVISNFSASLGMAGMLAAIADFLLILLVFGFMNNSRSANFFFSLPIKRGNLFLTKFLVCVTVTFVPALIAGFIPVIYTGGLAAAWVLMLYLMLTHIFFLGTALLCVMLIGQSVAFAVISVIVQFVPAMALEISRSFLRSCLYGYSNVGVSGIINNIFCPVYYYPSISTSMLKYSLKINVISLVILTLLGIVCAVLAFFAFRGRRAESAGDIVAFKHIQPVFKYGVAVCSGMFFTYVMIASFNVDPVNEKNLIGVCLMIVFNTALGYFISEMLIQKKFNIFKGTVRGFAVTAALLVVLAGCVELDVFGLETRVPDAANIGHVYISYSGTAFSSAEDIANAVALHEFLISQKKTYEADKRGMAPATVQAGTAIFSPYDFMYKDREYTEETSYSSQYMESHFPTYLDFNYVMKDGKRLRRTYTTSALFHDQSATEELGRLFYALSHTYARANQQLLGGFEELDNKAIAEVHTGDMSIKLDHTKAVKLFDAVIADMKAMNIGIDEVAPPTARRPETLMNSTVTIIGGEMYEEYYTERTDSALYGYPQASSSYKGVVWSITLDTRAENTLALLDEWKIEVK